MCHTGPRTGWSRSPAAACPTEALRNHSRRRTRPREAKSKSFLCISVLLLLPPNMSSLHLIFFFFFQWHLTNEPHVLMLRPVARRNLNRDHQISLTLRLYRPEADFTPFIRKKETLFIPFFDGMTIAWSCSIGCCFFFIRKPPSLSSTCKNNEREITGSLLCKTAFFFLLDRKPHFLGQFLPPQVDFLQSLR